LVDSYRQETREYDFLNYALFVTFFPQLIAGPIVHHGEMMPQFASKWNLVKKYKNIATGIFIFAIGLFKKVVIADTFAVWATNGFDKAETLNLLEGWATSLSYTFQLYFDFSGYTDMAIGIALLFNIKLPINFNSPYKALSIQDFWRRWHITLSRFLRDYIYIPLGGNRLGSFRTYANLMTTFILGGLWHGAGWTFLFWGFLHGLALVIHRLWSQLKFKLNRFLAWFITFNFINISWVFFRAKEWDDAMKVLGAMFGGEPIFSYWLLKKFPALEDHLTFGKHFENIEDGNDIALWLIIGFIVILLFKNSGHYLSNFKPTTFNLLIFLLLSISAILHLTHVSEFLYFNF
jgi:D-alanyl-lipoteichoic acid acyltransferase DltB (MBOAT superfamily)